MTGRRAETGSVDAAATVCERAQSNVLGFVFVFTIIVATIGIVYAVGLPVLQDVQSDERIDNMERAFEILDDNVEDVVYGGAPSRATEVRLTGGSLTVTESSTVTLSVQNTSNTSDNATYTATTRPIVFNDEGTTILTSFGAVIRSDGDAATMLARPEWLIEDDRAVVPFVVTAQGSGSSSVGGSLTLLVVTDAINRDAAGQFTTGPNSQANVTVTVESEYASAWKRYFEDGGLTAVDADASDGEITYRFHTDALYVPRVRMDVDLKR